MGAWACGIGGCAASYDQPGPLIRHQAVNHPTEECGVCGETIPAGYLGIRHAFKDHTRAEFVRAYEADSDAIRVREELMEVVEEHVDVDTIVSQLEVGAEDRIVSADD